MATEFPEVKSKKLQFLDQSEQDFLLGIQL